MRRWQLRGIALCLMVAGSTASAADTPHWTYEGHHGPGAWASLDPGYASCSGLNQSPVDLADTVDAELPPLQLTPAADLVALVDNGHTLQVNAGGDSRLQLDGRAFTLRQFHFHAPSEHRIDGRQFPLEAHLVHSDADGRLAVIGVLFDAGASHPLLQALVDHLPTDSAPRAIDTDLAAASLLPDQHDYFRYNGSLTTPPCSEGVRWIVVEQASTATAEQIAHIARAMHGPNNRPLQPLNARLVLD